MYKTTLPIAIVIAGVLSASAQLQVTSNGNILVGEQQQGVAVDSLAVLTVLGPDRRNGAGRITFGNGKNVWIGEQKSSDGYDTDILWCYGRNGFRLVAGEEGSPTVCRFNPTGEQSQAFISNYNVKAPAFITVSDSRLKANVRELSGRQDALLELTPVEYDLTAPQAASREAGTAGADVDSYVPDGRRHFGLMAQEVREYFPNLVVEDEDGYLGVDYTGFIPLLIEAYASSRQEIDELRETVSSLAAALSDGQIPEGTLRKESADSRLSVTVNGSNVTAALSGMKEGTEGHLSIDEVSGSFSKAIPFTVRTEGTVTLDCGTLNPGVYALSAVENDSRFASRTIVVK